MFSFFSDVIFNGLLSNVFSKVGIFWLIEFVESDGDLVIFLKLELIVDLYCLLSKINLFKYGCISLFKNVLFV